MHRFCRPAGNFALAVAVVTGASLMAFAPAAHASAILIQIDDLTDNIFVDTYEDGVPVSHYDAGGEIYSDSFTLLNSATLVADVDARFNIFEVDGSASDRMRVYGSSGDNFVNVDFVSDSEGGKFAIYLNATHIDETGDWQTTLVLPVSNGDVYTWQFRSDIDAVPLPGAIWLFGSALVGAAGVGKCRKKRKNAAARAAA